ncbi:MAG: hypothetical protein U0746_08530 [Gemmataceae bacterium]
MSQTLLDPVATARSETGYFQRKWPVYLIFGSFFFLTIPLCFLAGGDPGYLYRLSAGSVYLWMLGMTHFLIAFALYFQGANLRYFASSPANRATYFWLPAIIFVSFDLYHALGIAVVLPTFDLVLRWAIRLADFQHSTRQSFGVLQLFRMRSGCRFPNWVGRAENHYFTGVALLLFVTFLSGGELRLERPATQVVLAAVVGLFIWNLVGFAVAGFRSGSWTALAAPFAYFLLQTCAAALAVYSTALYAFGLAMHYVEYHVLMAPRCFHTSLDKESRPDQFFGQFRRHKIVFYGLLLALAVPVMRFAWQGMSELMRVDDSSLGLPSRVAISIFDGLFVFHYLIESRIWKFRDPYYRRTLIPLYFQAGASAESTTPDRPVAGNSVSESRHAAAVP